MSTGRAIQVSVTHTVLGVGVGAAIEASLPAFSAGASLTNLIFETLVQVGLNGVALASVSEFLRDDVSAVSPWAHGRDRSARGTSTAMCAPVAPSLKFQPPLRAQMSAARRT